MKRIIIGALLCLLNLGAFAQQNDSLIISKIFDEALSRGKSYEMLSELTTKIGPRLSGSSGAQKAVEWGKAMMESFGFDTVFLQEVMVPHWVRGDKESAWIEIDGQMNIVPITALGGSIATPAQGLTSEVVEVHTFDELEALGKDKVKGKIVFFNRPMDPTLLRTFNAYGQAANQRTQGAIQAAKYGAIGVIVRSLTTLQDDNPHTGAMAYDADVKKIPAACISTNGANLLSDKLKLNPYLKFHFSQHCETLPDALSYNVVGEIKGSTFPDEIILVGGHLDSWDLAEGAHDDGAGTVQSIEALRLFKALNIKPKHTLRAVLFMNEENGLRGGLKYAELAKKNKENHLVAIESDAGGFTPRGFTISAPADTIRQFMAWKPLLSNFGLGDIGGGWGGADIGPLKPQGTILIALLPDSQRYFDYHHAATDVLEAVNKRELQLGAAAMASLMYLVDTHGIK